MQQGNVIFGVILIAYIVFITQRGELPAYLTLLRGGGAQPGGSGISVTGSGVLGAPIAAGINAGLNQAGVSTQAGQGSLFGPLNTQGTAGAPLFPVVASPSTNNYIQAISGQNIDGTDAIFGDN